MPAGAEKSAFRRASASAPSIVEARASAVFKPCRITRRVYAGPPTRRPPSALRGRTGSSAAAAGDQRPGREDGGVGGAVSRAPDTMRPHLARRDPVIIAAADGSALGNPGPAGWAWYVDDSCWAAGGWPHATNNQAI